MDHREHRRPLQGRTRNLGLVAAPGTHLYDSGFCVLDPRLFGQDIIELGSETGTIGRVDPGHGGCSLLLFGL